MATRSNHVSFGLYGLKAQESAWITSNQIEAARITLSKKTQKGGKLWIRIFPDKPITSKPNETGLGGGKGEVANHVAVVRPGQMLFEIAGIDEAAARETLKQAGYKLPIKTVIVTRV